MSLARLDVGGLLDHVFRALGHGRGGWVVTANLDFLRRHSVDPQARALYDAADLRVADGMPLVWAARLQGDPVPGRVAGSSLMALIAERAAAERRSMYLLGGSPGAADRAASVLRGRWPELVVCGTSSPTISLPPTEAEREAIRAEVARARPDVLLVGMGSPKQEQLIQALRPHFPATWMMGVGTTFSFVAGDIARAPTWMQRAGIEWLHRLAQEPRRLARRYLLEDLPFSFRLFGHALAQRLRRPDRG